MFFMDVPAIGEEGNRPMSLLNVGNGLPSEAASYHGAAETSKLAMFVIVYWQILSCIRDIVLGCKLLELISDVSI
jgi:hypothetical protein